MKKVMTVLLSVLLLGALLLGCTPGEPGPTEATFPAETAPIPTEAVEADVRYFVNEMEYNRLYSIREDGTDLKPVVDKRCYSVWQLEDTVYYMTGSLLESYHIPTGNIETLAESVLSFYVTDNHLVYMIWTDNFGEMDLRHRNLADGSDTSIATIDSGRFWTGNGRVVYANFDYDSSMDMLYEHDLKTGETREIARDFNYFGSALPVEEGVYFEGSSDTAEGWFFSPSDGFGYETAQWQLTDLSNLLRVSENGILYMSWDTETFTDSIHFVDENGTDTVLMTSDENSSLYAEQVSADSWMIRQYKSIGWGDINEYGYYDKYAYRVDYLLLDSEGNLTPLDVTGEAGNLFPEGDFPLLDSSTARIPVTSALYDLFVKNYDYEGQEPICSTTHGAWLNIADRKVDLALLAAPTPEEQAYLEEQGIEIEMKLYGGDGLVFIGNAENPVANLTHEQIIGIYRGEITNWSQVGGPDHPIIVYYRDEQSGSQRLFKNLVFKGLEVPDFEAMNLEGRNVWLMDDMSSIVDVILAEPYAIGYSIMTYLDEVYAEENLRVFQVEGTLPSPETVADGSYRYHTQGYLVIRSDEPENSPARRLFDWFGCPVSDDLLTDCGVSPLHDSNG